LTGLYSKDPELVALAERRRDSFPSQIDDAYPFVHDHGGDWDGSESPMKCKCGSDQFAIIFPAFVTTAAICMRCGARGIIHEG
jgi:hypothetical protein